MPFIPWKSQYGFKPDFMFSSETSNGLALYLTLLSLINPPKFMLFFEIMCRASPRDPLRHPPPPTPTTHTIYTFLEKHNSNWSPTAAASIPHPLKSTSSHHHMWGLNRVSPSSPIPPTVTDERGIFPSALRPPSPCCPTAILLRLQMRWARLGPWWWPRRPHHHRWSPRSRLSLWIVDVLQSPVSIGYVVSMGDDVVVPDALAPNSESLLAKEICGLLAS